MLQFTRICVIVYVIVTGLLSLYNAFKPIEPLYVIPDGYKIEKEYPQELEYLEHLQEVSNQWV